MKYLLILITVFQLITFKAAAQDDGYPVINYTTKDYGRSFHPANQTVINDHRGVIYAANGFKLLEYDGSGWKSYPINKETWILSLAIDKNGIIYAGSQNEFGYFSPDARGELTYYSLSDSLDPEEKNFTNIWKVHSLPYGVFFQGEEKLFIYKNGDIKVIKPETTFHTSFHVNNRFYIRERGLGLMEWRGDRLSGIKGGEVFDTTGIFLMLPLGKNSSKILIGTREKGFWIYDTLKSMNAFRKFHLSDESLIDNAVITGGTVTGDGHLALCTMHKGVIIIDTTGMVRTIIDKENGLTDNDVKDIASDLNENLWVSLNNGISRIEISSPLSVFSENSGIRGSIYSILRFNGLLYAGTSSGLFVYDPSVSRRVSFMPVTGINFPVWSLVKASNSLIAGTDAGLFIVDRTSAIRADQEGSYALFFDTQSQILLSGGSKGLRAYKKEGALNRIPSFTIENEDIIGIAPETNATGEAAEFWLGTRYRGLIRLRVKKDHSFSFDRFGNSDGLPGGPVIPCRLSQGTMFATIQGIYSFINENSVKESLPDSLKNNKDFLKGYFTPAAGNFKVSGQSVSAIVESNDKIWICAGNNVGYLDRSDSLKYFNRPFRGIDAGKINTIYPDENGILWIGATEGLIKYDGNRNKKYDQRYYSLIRRVSLIDNDSSIFLGTGFRQSNRISEIVPGLPSALAPTLNYSNNSVRFEFSAPFYEYQDKILYSYKLEGMNSKWSPWSTENYKEFTNLREGSYTFIVKSINIYGTESAETSYTFNILPPWHRTVIAYIIYAILALVILWLSARLYTLRLKRENIRLEGIIKERTAEVVRQKDEIVEKNTVLEYQKKEIEDSIRYARRIQSAVIPSEKLCREIFPESFVFFRPLNIVSGDFYWISRVENKIIYTAADCTGHGVPGAFMSMLGVAFLNEIVNKDKITSPELILNSLREKVIKALQQQGVTGETRDGMDIAMVCIDPGEGKLEYAGAYNPLIMVRNSEIFETPGEKMPIGIYENMRGFIKHEIRIEKGDSFYMFSDGYEDQFGGPDGKKFKAKRLKNLLLEISRYPVYKQKELLESNFDSWKGDLPQVDDIVIVGIAIS